MSADGKRVLICFAVKEEAKPFLRTAVSKRAAILITGMGKRNAEQSLRKYLKTVRPNLVLSCGFAGGLNPELKAGETIFSADDNFPFASKIAIGARRGSFHCVTRIASTAAEKSVLRLQTGADAVEMESAIVRRICWEEKIPSATIRVISDAAHEDLPLDFNQLMTSKCELSFFKLSLALLAKPWKIPLLLRLGEKAKVAAENLNRVLESLPI
ncbi:MAG: hypothetical protein ABIR24_11035 [Verrucomicrobiota bacterium]